MSNDDICFTYRWIFVRSEVSFSSLSSVRNSTFLDDTFESLVNNKFGTCPAKTTIFWIAALQSEHIIKKLCLDKNQELSFTEGSLSCDVTGLNNQIAHRIQICDYFFNTSGSSVVYVLFIRRVVSSRISKDFWSREVGSDSCGSAYRSSSGKQADWRYELLCLSRLLTFCRTGPLQSYDVIRHYRGHLWRAERFNSTEGCRELLRICRTTARSECETD